VGRRQDFVICRDGRVIPVPSGVYVHDRPASEPIGVLPLAAALVTAPMPGVVMVHPAPGAERATIVLRFLGGLPERVRDRVVVTPPQSMLDGRDLPGLEELADLYGVPLILPLLEWVRGSAREMPVNSVGEEEVWDRAVAVLLLTRAQMNVRSAAVAAWWAASAGQLLQRYWLAGVSSGALESSDTSTAAPIDVDNLGSVTSAAGPHWPGAVLPVPANRDVIVQVASTNMEIPNVEALLMQVVSRSQDTEEMVEQFADR
jgi:hypothetical protein